MLKVNWYSASGSSFVGVEYIIMEKVVGVGMESRWLDMCK